MTMLALFSVAAFAQNNTKETAPAAKEIKGTVFEKGTLKELLAKAAKEKKYLFVDVYATWCGPCKAMATQVFPQEKWATTSIRRSSTPNSTQRRAKASTSLKNTACAPTPPS